ILPLRRSILFFISGQRERAMLGYELAGLVPVAGIPFAWMKNDERSRCRLVVGVKYIPLDRLDSPPLTCAARRQQKRASRKRRQESEATESPPRPGNFKHETFHLESLQGWADPQNPQSFSPSTLTI